MATGAGKTRTVIALADLLIRANWAKRVLFLADRTALVKQAVNAFKRHLPDSAPVNLVTERDGEGRVYVSTYPTMLNLINDVDTAGRRRFGPGYFDLVVIDEAHRSVFSKYRAIFEWYDSLLIGLTATPRSEIDRNTYGLFDLEPGVPTDNYGLDEAVADGFLVPMRAVSMPTRFMRQGIRYDELPEDEQLQWEELWDEVGDGGPTPTEVDAAELNKRLFNADTVDKVLGHLMTRGLKVAGGDRIAKTIVFAANQRHAEFVATRFDAQYPNFRGEFARAITHQVDYSQQLIDDFSVPDRPPHIAISVDMLDTGIDIPEVANLLFFKRVYSKTKFWQMIGRGTRLCPDLFGPGEDKQFFYVFDFCQNLEYFNQNPPESGGSVAPSLSARLFTTRLDLIAALDSAGAHPAVRSDIAELLRVQVAAMNPSNVVVRSHRELVERFSSADAWDSLGPGELSDLATSVAGLPTEIESEPEEAKRFDLLVLSTEIALLRGSRAYTSLTERVRTIASLLEGLGSVPAVAAELPLIAEVESDEWWVGVTLPMLEHVRRRLRLLVPLIEKRRRTVIYSDFTDELGEGTIIDVGGIAAAGDFERFRRKARQWLTAHDANTAVHKLRHNWPITVIDLEELERIFVDNGVGTWTEVERAREMTGGFGLFVRRLVGLDREAAKDSLAGFLDDGRFTANQIDFVSLVIDELTTNGVVEPRRFYESPFIDVAPHGPDALFESVDVDRLVAAVTEVRRRAEAAA